MDPLQDPFFAVGIIYFLVVVPAIVSQHVMYSTQCLAFSEQANITAYLPSAEQTPPAVTEPGIDIHAAINNRPDWIKDHHPEADTKVHGKTGYYKYQPEQKDHLDFPTEATA